MQISIFTERKKMKRMFLPVLLTIHCHDGIQNSHSNPCKQHITLFPDKNHPSIHTSFTKHLLNQNNIHNHPTTSHRNDRTTTFPPIHPNHPHEKRQTLQLQPQKRQIFNSKSSKIAQSQETANELRGAGQRYYFMFLVIRYVIV